MAIQLRRGLEADRLSITPASGEPIWTTDTKKLYIGDGVTAGGILVTGGGGSGWTVSIAPDANIVAVPYHMYVIPSATFTANRNIDMSGLTAEGDQIWIFNQGSTYTLTYTGANVYDNAGSTVATAFWRRNAYIVRANSKNQLIISI